MRRSLFIAALAANAVLTALTPTALCCEIKIDSQTEPAGVLKITIANVNVPLIRLFEGSEKDFKGGY